MQRCSLWASEYFYYDITNNKMIPKYGREMFKEQKREQLINRGTIEEGNNRRGCF